MRSQDIVAHGLNVTQTYGYDGGSRLTRSFAAASAATQELADLATRGLGRAGTSADTRKFLENTSQTLLSQNTHIVGEILFGQISGSGLHREVRRLRNPNAPIRTQY